MCDDLATWRIDRCWGSWVVMHACGSDDYATGVSVHPSHTKLCPGVGEDAATVVGAVKCPQLILPTNNDPPDVHPGGSNESILSAAGIECQVVSALVPYLCAVVNEPLIIVFSSEKI